MGRIFILGIYFVFTFLFTFANISFAESLTKNGYTLNVDSSSSSVSASIRQGLIDTFFAVYPQMASRFNPNAPKTVNFKFEENPGAPAMSGGSETTFDSNYLNQNAKDKDIVTHETMHLVQGYGNSGIPGWLVEGIADYARYKYGVANEVGGWSLGASPGSNYDEGYRVTARFLVWVDDHYGAKVIDKLDASGRTGYSDSIWQQETGKGVQELWQEYMDNSAIKNTEGKGSGSIDSRTVGTSPISTSTSNPKQSSGGLYGGSASSPTNINSGGNYGGNGTGAVKDGGQENMKPDQISRNLTGDTSSKIEKEKPASAGAGTIGDNKAEINDEKSESHNLTSLSDISSGGESEHIFGFLTKLFTFIAEFLKELIGSI